MSTSSNRHLETGSPPESVRKVAGHGVLWSIAKHWLNKVSSFLLAIFLVRLLSPEEFGIASAAALALILVPLIAEMGFGDSILQRRDLKSADVNLPFLVASIISACLVTVIVVLREPIAAWAGLAGRTSYLVAVAATFLITVPTAFQEAMYKRAMRFKDLAMRAIVANIAGGVAALIAALAGFGVWTFVVQAYVSLIINVVWIWRRPEWMPSCQFEAHTFFQMLRFSGPVLVQRLVDFVGIRTLDFIIISQVGMIAYGVYVAGSKLYQTMMLLLQSAFYDVSLTVLSTIAYDRARIAEIYLKTIAIAANVMSPIFVMLAALAPEICLVLFGAKWDGVDSVAQPLLLMGAVHCVQYMNGAFLSARGRPELVLVSGVTKSVLQILAVLLLASSDVTQMTWVFVAAALLASPLEFTMVGHEIGLSFTDITGILWRPALISAASFLTVFFARPLIAELELAQFFLGVLLGVVFGACYLFLLALIDLRRFTDLLSHVAKVVRKLA